MVAGAGPRSPDHSGTESMSWPMVIGAVWVVSAVIVAVAYKTSISR